MKGKNTKPEINDSAELKGIILNGGYDPTGKYDLPLSIEDATTSQDLSALLPETIVEIMIEAQAPMMTLTPLLEVVPWKLGVTEYKLPAMGVINVDRIGEGESYPEKRLQIGGALSQAQIDKWGVALSFTDEAIKYSRWDIVSKSVTHVGRAFQMRKETEVAKHITSLAQPVFDNRNPLRSVKGVTTGRDINLEPNGSFTMDDMFELFAHVMTTGYQPNLMIMHPQTWTMFMKDPTLRAFAHANGGGTLFGSYTGSPVNKRRMVPESISGVVATGNRNASVGNNFLATQASNLRVDFDNQMNSAPVLPTYFPWSVQIVVSPYMKFDVANKLTDIIVCDRSALGSLVVEEDLTMDEWNDPRVDIRYMKFRERYGFYIDEEGMGQSVAKNVKIEPNFWTGEPARGDFNISEIVAIDPTTAVV